MSCIIVAAGSIRDGLDSMAPCDEMEILLENRGISLRTLSIDPLAAGWNTPVLTDHYRSGCAPLEALDAGRKLIVEGEADAVIVHGKDRLRTGYSREARLEQMAIYGNEYPLTAAYTDLASQFIRDHNITEGQFKALCHDLFENYQRSYAELNRNAAIPARWFEPVTSLFRGVDCANPSIDFEGKLILVNSTLAKELKPHTAVVAVKGSAVSCLEGDGAPYIGPIARYEHLAASWQRCQKDAGVDFKAVLAARQALLEIYTCYPVVPLGFLLATGLVDKPDQLTSFVARYPLTVTGGLNLARAPWNSPALNGLIAVTERLRTGAAAWGAVHGNGGLGYKQGVALLQAARVN